MRDHPTPLQAHVGGGGTPGWEAFEEELAFLSCLGCGRSPWVVTRTVPSCSKDHGAVSALWAASQGLNCVSICPQASPPPQTSHAQPKLSPSPSPSPSPSSSPSPSPAPATSSLTCPGELHQQLGQRGREQDSLVAPREAANDFLQLLCKPHFKEPGRAESRTGSGEGLPFQ